MKIKNFLFYFSLLILISVLIFKISLLFNQPLDFDEAAYATIARGINEGMLPYVDFFDHKPPLNYYPLAWLFNLFGVSIFVIHLLGFIWGILLIFSVFILSRSILGENKYAVIATAITSVFFIQNSLINETPMALFGVLGIYFYLTYLDGKGRYNLFFSGILIGISLWFKQPGILFFIAIAMHEIYLVAKNKSTKKQSINNIFLVILGILLTFIPLLSYFTYVLGFKKLYYSLITFNLIFSGSTSRVFTIGKLFLLMIAKFGFLIPLIFFLPRKQKITSFLMAYFIILFLFFLINKEIFSQHLFQAAPLVAIAAVYSLSKIKSKNLEKIGSILIILFFLILVLTFLEGFVRIENNSQSQLISGIKRIVPDNSEVFSDNPIYSFLGGYEPKYKVFYLAPSIASVFDFSDFCEYAKSADYLILTHRKVYLGGENLDCIETNFKLEKKFENADEYFVEVWKNKNGIN